MYHVVPDYHTCISCFNSRPHASLVLEIQVNDNCVMYWLISFWAWSFRSVPCIERVRRIVRPLSNPPTDHPHHPSRLHIAAKRHPKAENPLPSKSPQPAYAVRQNSIPKKKIPNPYTDHLNHPSRPQPLAYSLHVFDASSYHIKRICPSVRRSTHRSLGPFLTLLLNPMSNLMI